MPVPDKAQKVFSGVIFDTYQWEQELYDGSTATFEMLKRPATLQVIPTVGDKIVIAHEEQPMKGPFFSLLGGRQDPGEDELEGAKRELLEESGLVSDDWELVWQVNPYNKVDWTIYTYVARNCTKVQEPDPGAGEKIELREVGFDEWIDVVTGDDFCGRELALHLFQMEKQGKLDAMKQKIFHK